MDDKEWVHDLFNPNSDEEEFEVSLSELAFQKLLYSL